MMKWFEDNPVGIGLSILCGALIFLLLTFSVVSSLKLTSQFDGSEVTGDEGILNLPQLAENQSIDNYSVITERPLFNESRQPIVGNGSEDEPPADLTDVDVGAPDVVLSGVIITPTLRMVTLRHKESDKSLVAFEGRPIEGEFGSWQVSRIHARAATLTSGDGEELELQLQVHDEKIEQPKHASTGAAKGDKAAAAVANSGEDAEPDAEPQTRAEEIRQRIAERREELRREAEEAEAAGETASQPSYREAIKNLVGRNRRPQTNDKDKQ